MDDDEELENPPPDDLPPEAYAQFALEDSRFPEDYDDDYSVDIDIEHPRQPLERLRERLAQSKQLLTLQGDSSVKALARNLSFASVITGLESFLWETVNYWVDYYDVAVANIVTKIPVFRDRALKLGEIFERREGLRNEVKVYLQNLVWHQWDKVAPLFKLGLEIDIPSFKQFRPALVKRHDIVHRSGLTREREVITVSDVEIADLCEQILRFAVEIDEKLGLRAARLAFGNEAPNPPTGLPDDLCQRDC